METRIKIIYWLTIIALAALVVIQGYWLFNQYTYTLVQYEGELFEKTIHVGQMDRNLRKELHDEGFKIMTWWKMEATQNNVSTFNPELEWVFDTYIIDTREIEHYNSMSLQQIDSLSEVSKDIEKYRFDIKIPNREYDVYDALERFHINKLCPFNTERFDSLLLTQGIKALSIKTEVTDSMVWNPHKISHTSIWNPTMEVTYPFNILQKEQVRITYKLGGSPILGKMLKSLLCSILISLLLAFCLIYQIRTIIKQQRIDELRKDFIKTMIHELKRPVATLKMCISFMKNDKMMQDKTMKDDIIHSSQNELDNLSSYFSKLRDLTYGDMEEIPLNLSTFNIKRLIEECIEKQNLPVDRQITITACFDNDNVEITADRMHVINIICNLLENAVKYSEGETSILIDGHSIDNKYIIEVSDNGFGISLAECPFVFDKFFRSSNIINKNIPGIGLGLSYVKLLVIAHKGKISLESTLASGSKFIIEIPKK
ncbi:sensor histidine kinase [Dysgonomonas termitidis]|uniref:histidine kinase n=1 Tax=Dysgonomonas termitidis TaxID=1516126 RepID=A0ABV9L3E5_9BACT